MADAKFIRSPLPIVPHFSSGTNSLNTFDLDASTDKVAWIFYPEDATTITKLGFNFVLRTGTPPAYKISLQSVTMSGASAGMPSGTIVGGASPASVTFTPPADATLDATFHWPADLTNSFLVTAGTPYAIVLEYDSGTINGTNFIRVAIGHDALGARPGVPYALTTTATTFSASVNTFPIFGYRDASRSYGYPIRSVFVDTYSSDTTEGNGGDERGIEFTLPAGWGAAFTVEVAEFMGAMSAAAKTIDMNLYENTTSRQAVTGIDSDVIRSASLFRHHELPFTDSSPYAASYGTAYILALDANETSSNLCVMGLNVQEAQDRAPFGLGTNARWAYRADAGAWQYLDTRVPLFWFRYGDITEPTGGSGSPNGGGASLNFAPFG